MQYRHKQIGWVWIPGVIFHPPKLWRTVYLKMWFLVGPPRHIAGLSSVRNVFLWASKFILMTQKFRIRGLGNSALWRGPLHCSWVSGISAAWVVLWVAGSEPVRNLGWSRNLSLLVDFLVLIPVLKTYLFIYSWNLITFSRYISVHILVSPFPLDLGL